MNEDPRCCGSGTCIIDTEGLCWCGQQWDGEKMCSAPLASPPAAAPAPDADHTPPRSARDQNGSPPPAA